MIVVPITPEMKMRARQYENLILKHDFLKPGGNPTGLEYPDRWYKGYLGEFVFWDILKRQNKMFVYRPHVDGKSDGFDFELFICKEWVTFDVKADATTKRECLKVNEYQYKKGLCRGYIDVWLDLGRNVAHVTGYVKAENLKFKPDGFTAEKRPTYYCPIEELIDISQLLVRIEVDPLCPTNVLSSPESPVRTAVI